MKILIDDERNEVLDGNKIIKPDLIARNYMAAIYLMIGFSDQTEVYLDHDLGEVKTGYDWITTLEEELSLWKVIKLPKKIVCVSSNPPGRARIQQVIDKLYEPLRT